MTFRFHNGQPPCGLPASAFLWGYLNGGVCQMEAIFNPRAFDRKDYDDDRSQRPLPLWVWAEVQALLPGQRPGGGAAGDSSS